jgi:GDP-D-mannose dehydratase
MIMNKLFASTVAMSVLATGGLCFADTQADLALDPNRMFLRPTEVDHLHGDSSPARAKLGWKPRVTFTELIQMMVRADEADVRGAITGRAPRR